MKFQVDMKINGVYYVLYIKLLSSSSLICYNYKYTMHSVYMYKVYLVWATFFSSSTSTFFSRYYRLEFIPYLFIFFSLSLSLPYQTYVFIYSCNKSYRNKLLIIHIHTYILISIFKRKYIKKNEFINL